MSTTLLERDPAPLAPDAEPPASRTSAPVIIAFGLVYVVWGSTYLAIRVGIESFPPLLLAGSRHLLTGFILYPILRWKTGVRPTAAQWRMSFITGFLLLCVGNGGVCLAERTVPSGVAALLVATVSLWMVLIDWLRPGGTRPGARVVAGLLLGFSGLALLVGPKNLGGSSRVDPIGVGLLVVASLAWAAGSVYSKHAGGLSGSPLMGAAMQCLAGGVSLWIAGIVSGEVGGLHLRAVSAVHLHFEEKHGDARGDLCVCESGGGAFSRVAPDWGNHQLAYGDRRGSDFDGCFTGDYRASPKAAASERPGR